MAYSSALLYLASITAAGILSYYLYTLITFPSLFQPKRTQKDYQQVYDEIASRLEEDYDYDDGSYGPILVRLAWHSSGTYDAKTGTGGSNGATMRYSPECSHSSNTGLDIARKFLEPVKGTVILTFYPTAPCLRNSC
jgi:cytochrome c peroxidase